jgi:preprotein translocase subunit SecB
MTENKKNYNIVSEFVKDISFETPTVETYIHVKDSIAKYKLKIDITSKKIKNKIIEVNMSLKLNDESGEEKRSHFEMTYTSIIKIEKEILNKEDLEKMILIDVPNEVYPRIENLFSTILDKSGFKGIGINKKIDFETLYKTRKN